MQQIIDLVAKLQSGESKKYSELRNAIAEFQYFREIKQEFGDIRTKEGKQRLLELAEELIAEYQVDNGESIESKIDEQFNEFEKEWERQVVPVMLQRLGSTSITHAAIWKIYQTSPSVATPDGLKMLCDEVDSMIDGEEMQGTYPELDWDTLADLAGATDKAMFRRLCIDPNELIEDSGEEPPQNEHPFVKEMRSIMTKERIVRGELTRNCFDNIREIQRHLAISGLESTSFECRGLKVDYLTEPFTLSLIKRDARKLWRQVNKLTDCFLQLAAMGEPKYKLSRVDYSDDDFGDCGEDLPTTYSQVREYAAKAKAAWICHESTQWEEKTQKIISTKHGECEARIGRGIDKPEEPDTIELHLTMDWKDFKTANASEIITFRLTHPYRD